MMKVTLLQLNVFHGKEEGGSLVKETEVVGVKEALSWVREMELHKNKLFKS